jgi:DNA-binding NtrC family response regulator
MTRKELLAQQEQEALARALEECGGDQTAAAAKLGLSLRTLQRRVQQYGWSRSRR